MSQKQEVIKGLEDFIFVSKYARWDEKLKRRETWDEAVDRVQNMHLDKYHYLSKEEKDEIRWAFSLVRDKKVLPSMRSMQFAGKAQLAHQARGYNCCVRHVDSIRAFAEIGYLMLCGCGTGIGLSKYFLSRLPNLVDAKDKTGTVINYTIEDTIEGWADSLEALMSCYFKNTSLSGRKIVFDYSKIRKKGTRLKIGGGRAPGYKPLKTAHTKIKKLLDKIIEVENTIQLKPIQAYDILMFFADAVLSGGIRRTASSVVFDKDDEDMMNAKTNFTVTKFRSSYDEETNIEHCKIWIKKDLYEVDFHLNDSFEKYDFEQLKTNKTINWFYIQPQRGRSNNSILLLRDELTKDELSKIIERTKIWGEPGFVLANHPHTIYNPCYEIGFIPVTQSGQCGVQFCNLVTQNGSLIKNSNEFLECIKAQTIIGTLQAGYTDFPYLSKVAKELTESEALLGNSITGILYNKELFLDPNVLTEAANLVTSINIDWAKKIGINPAARKCCLKPEGTGSMAIGVHRPGIHAGHAPEYYRRTQTTIGEPIYEFFKKHNPDMCETSVWNTNGTDEVISWPISLNDGGVFKKDISAIEHLEMAKTFKKYWIDESCKDSNKKDVSHNVSITVIVKHNEWKDIVDYLFDNRYDFAAVSFLSVTGDKDYRQAPYEAITNNEEKQKFLEMIENYKKVDYTQLIENHDDTSHTAEQACAGGICLI